MIKGGVKKELDAWTMTVTMMEVNISKPTPAVTEVEIYNNIYNSNTSTANNNI